MHIRVSYAAKALSVGPGNETSGSLWSVVVAHERRRQGSPSVHKDTALHSVVTFFFTLRSNRSCPGSLKPVIF